MNVRKVKIIDIRKLDRGISDKREHSTEPGEITYERHFGGCLFAGSRFEQKRTQLHRTSERDAYDAASDCELHREGERCNYLNG